MLRPPLSIRQDPEKLERFHAFRERVPQGLLRSLLSWIDGRYCELDSWSVTERVTNHDRVSRLERVLNTELPRKYNEFMNRMGESEILLLDAVDHALYAERDRDVVMRLKTMLDEARSVYTVGVDEDRYFQLQLRQPSELTAIVEAAADGASNASVHLRDAWSKAFARVPDPASACVEIVKAIEVAAKPVVTPDDPRATLGKMIKAMRDKPNKWTTDAGAPADVESVISLIDLVWTGCPRHGDDTQPAEVATECAQMLVQAGAMLVHWFQTGRVRAA